MALVRYLQAIRDWAGAAINIESGYRTEEHNEDVGGAEDSKHLDGMAADISCNSKSPLEIARKAESLGMLGIEWGVTGNYTHVDTRTVKWFARCVNGIIYEDFNSFYDLNEA